MKRGEAQRIGRQWAQEWLAAGGSSGPTLEAVEFIGFIRARALGMEMGALATALQAASKAIEGWR